MTPQQFSSLLRRRVCVAESDRRPTVLVIDDEPLVRRIVRRALEPEASVLEAADGKAGLDLLDRPETRAVDLVVTDFMMPRVGGLEVMAVLNRYRPDVAIIGMTGHADLALREAAAKYGVRVLQKPFEIGALLASVREVLAESRARRGVQGRRQACAGVRPPPAGLVAAAKALAIPVKV